ncbi:MAG: hypothetical protein QGH45_19165, partial [Myxococcota bacterium]|nr:hypothetical protein [Myxococcota bacterium]
MEYASWSVLVGIVVAVGLAGALAGCAHLIPTRASVDESRFLGPPADPPPTDGDHALEAPVLPFPIWGLHFDEELVLELLDHPSWRMIEIVRLEHEDREVWFTLEAHRCGRQWVGVPAGNEAYASGFPAPIYPSDLEIERTATDRELRYRAAWTMQTGERIEIEADTPLPLKPMPLRSGNAMNHSQETALALIDLELRRASRVRATIDGTPRRVASLSRGILVQTAAGVMEGVRSFRAAGDGGVVATAADGTATVYRREPAEGGFELVTELPLSTERWHFVERDGGAHLSQVILDGPAAELLKLRFNPPLADLRTPPVATSVSRAVASIHGLPGYMAAEIRIEPGEVAGTANSTANIVVEPSTPRWAKQRPVRSILSWPEDGTAAVETAVEPTAAWSFGD